MQDRSFGHRLVLIFFLWGISLTSFAQEKDTTVTMSINGKAIKQQIDSLGKEEFAPLDIEEDRGLYIITADEKMQLRILGSVRFLLVTDFIDSPLKNTFISYFIPIGEDRVTVPNYYSDVAQSRLGFEVLRKLKDQDLFIRMEMDFAGGVEGRFRIRHAYGKYKKFLIGQTWSLFSNVTAMPRTVNFDGPTGGVILRTPQIRYFDSNKNGVRWAMAFEYSRPDVNLSQFDSTGLSVVQLIPDFTARVERDLNFGHLQLSTVINTISVLDEDNEVSNVLGFGGSLTGTIDVTTGTFLYQLAYGQSISHFITTFSGTGNDAYLDPTTGNIFPVTSLGGFVGYDHDWTDAISSNLVYGYANLENESFQPDNAYRRSHSLALNTFWKVVDGAWLGLELMHAERTNKGGESGDAQRISVLFSYDF